VEIRDRVALVTGASRGLGRALAEELARRGAKVVLVARDAGPLAEAAERIVARGGRAWAVAGDVGEPGSEVAIVGRAAALAGTVDILVNNASTLGAVPMPLLADARPDDVRRTFEVNVLGPFRLARAVLGPMLLHRQGLVVNVSSDAAVEPYPGWGAYGASKAALDHMTRILAAELAGSGVRAVAIDPGEMDTEMHAAAIPDADPASLARPSDVARAIVSAIARGVPTGPRVVASALDAGVER
jgi:NAD(P)-dependent dehydrogenase (short-subunit alcohol dehydrogenase family)